VEKQGKRFGDNPQTEIHETLEPDQRERFWAVAEPLSHETACRQFGTGWEEYADKPACPRLQQREAELNEGITHLKARALARKHGLQIGDVDIETAELEILELRERRPGLPEAYWYRALLNKLRDAARRRPQSLDELAEREETEGQAVAGSDSFGHPLERLPRRLTRNFVEDKLIAHLDGNRPAAVARARVLTYIASAIVKRAGEIVSINRELGHEAYIARLRESKKIGLYRLRHELTFSSNGRTFLTAWITTDLTTRQSWVTVSHWTGESIPFPVELRGYKSVEGQVGDL